MKHRWLVVTCLILASSACSRSPADTEDVSFDRADGAGTLGLTSGTSFGMCMGYCTTELVMDSATVWFIETSRMPTTQPTKAVSLTLSATEWNRLRALVDPTTLTSLAGIHGCPDCADGGSEWIEIESSKGPVRVTFEYGQTLNPIAALQAEIRSIRARFP